MDDREGQQVVLRFRDGRAIRGTLHGEFAPATEATVSIRTAEDDLLEADLESLKAVFFLKDPRKRALAMALGNEAAPEGGIARVEFFDGEILRGSVRRYAVGERGFFLEPLDPASNNERVFVVARAVQSVEIGS
jgi:hypothetical protein